jgi:hypothetical protein
MHAVGAAGWLSIQHIQPARACVDPIGGDLGAIAVRGVHVPTGAIEDQERRIGEVLQQLNQRPRSCLGVPLIDAQPFAAATVLRGKAADIHELRRSLTAVALSLEDRCSRRTRAASQSRSCPSKSGEKCAAP